MPRKGSKRVKSKTHAKEAPEGATILNRDGTGAPLEKNDTPRSIVAKVSKVVVTVNQLVRDLRKLMGPHTAYNLKERKTNRLKDFSSVATQLKISHLLAISQTKSNSILRIAKTRTGPTLHFKISEFMLAGNVRKLQKRPYDSAASYNTPPMVILNGFGSSEDKKVILQKATFQHMFPSIDVDKVKLSECKRVVLFNYDDEKDCVEMRHYVIKTSPVGVSKNVKHLVKGSIPDIGQYEDISQLLQGQDGNGPQTLSGFASDSEVEDETSHLAIPRSTPKDSYMQQSSLKLAEIGPRMTLSLFKVEKGIGEGDILFHKYVQKSDADAAKTKQRIEQEKSLKASRRAIQEENVKRKRELQQQKLDEKRQRKQARIEAKQGVNEKESSDADDEDDGNEDEDSDDDDDDDGGDINNEFSGGEDSAVENSDFLDSDEED